MGGAESGTRQDVRDLLLAQISGNEMQPRRRWHAAVGEPAPLQALSGGVIDLEYFYIAREGRLPQGKTVQACAYDDVLACASFDSQLQCVFGVPSAQYCPTITWMRLQCAVQDRIRSTELLASRPIVLSSAVQDNVP